MTPPALMGTSSNLSRTQGAMPGCRAQPGLLQGSGGNPIPPTPADPAVLPREHFQLKQRVSQGQNAGLGRLMVSFGVANPLKSTDKSGT